jgi:hypothetical protein
MPSYKQHNHLCLTKLCDFQLHFSLLVITVQLLFSLTLCDRLHKCFECICCIVCVLTLLNSESLTFS